MANVVEFTIKVIDDASKRIASIQDRLVRFAKRVAVAATAMTVAFAAVARQTIKTVDEYGKLVDRLGGTTEAFSELEHVANLSGVSFRNMSLGLQRMTRRISEAKEGTGEAVDALKELNLSAERLAELPLEQQFEVVADALHNLESASDRTRLAMRLFDSEGVALLQTMTRGAEGIREMREEARRLGISLSRDQVDAATEANDALTRLLATFTGIKTQIVVALAPAIESVTNSLQRLASEVFGEETITQQLEEIEVKIERQRARIERWGDSWFANTEGLNQELDRLLDRQDELLMIQGELIEQSLDESIQSVASSYDAAADAAAEYAKIQETINEALEKFQAQFQLEQRFKNAINSIEDTSDSLDDFMSAMEDSAEAVANEARDIGLQFASSFEEAFIQGKKFQDLLKGILQDILRLAARKFVTEPLTNLFGGAFEKLLGRQTGGPVQKGRPFLVGEGGPEVFIPNASGEVVSNQRLQRSASSAGAPQFVTNIDARGADPSLISRLPQIFEQRDRQLLLKVQRLIETGAV